MRLLISFLAYQLMHVARRAMARATGTGWSLRRLHERVLRAGAIRTSVLLVAQGWRDHDDADALRGDPAFRLAVSSVSGRTPLDLSNGLAS